MHKAKMHTHTEKQHVCCPCTNNFFKVLFFFLKNRSNTYPPWDEKHRKKLEQPSLWKVPLVKRKNPWKYPIAGIPRSFENPDPSIPFLGEKSGWNSITPTDGIIILKKKIRTLPQAGNPRPSIEGTDKKSGMAQLNSCFCTTFMMCTS